MISARKPTDQRTDDCAKPIQPSLAMEAIDRQLTNIKPGRQIHEREGFLTRCWLLSSVHQLHPTWFCTRPITEASETKLELVETSFGVLAETSIQSDIELRTLSLLWHLP